EVCPSSRRGLSALFASASWVPTEPASAALSGQAQALLALPRCRRQSLPAPSRPARASRSRARTDAVRSLSTESKSSPPALVDAAEIVRSSPSPSSHDDRSSSHFLRFGCAVFLGRPPSRPLFRAASALAGDLTRPLHRLKGPHWIRRL